MASQPKSYTQEIRNHEALEKLAKKLQPLIVTPEATPPPIDTDFFKRLNMAAKIESNTGSHFVIDVQPDLRFPLYYFIYNVEQIFPELDVRSFPYVSPFSLIAYDQILLIAHLLLCDIHQRSPTSHQANAFRRNNTAKDFLAQLTECYVPKHLEPLITQLVSVFDPSRPNLSFVPNLASFAWLYDYGRCTPATIMIAAHNIIASLRTNQTPDEILRAFYSTLIATVNNINYHVTNLTGGWYRVIDNDHAHSNWINQAIEEIFNPVVGRALTNRPSLARIRINAPVIAQVEQVNPYAVLMGYSDANAPALSAMLSNISNYIKTANLGNKTLLQISGESSGITILSHSIEPPTLPTWHRLANAAADPTPRTDEQYAADIHFMRPKVIGNQNLPVPTAAQCLPVLALAQNSNCTADNEPCPADEFDPRYNVYPPVCFFQPFDRSPSVLNYTVILGLKIESAEIDAVAIPTINVRDSTIDNNSRYRQGSLPIGDTYMATFNEAHPLILTERVLHNDAEDPCGLAIFDMTRNVLPRFGNEHVVRPGANLPGFVDLPVVHRPHDAFTYSGYSGDDSPPLQGRKLYVWSSYRYARTPTAQDPHIHIYFTFRGMYGLDTTVCRSENPARILPH